MEANTSSTYEATKARQSTQSQPDKIHWDGEVAFRDKPYRLLHHQRGVIGVFRIRLLEASELKRSHWSALALGPLKHVGLSKAHGDVSSFCVLSLAFDFGNEVKQEGAISSLDGDKKPAARSTADTNKQPSVTSPVVPSDNSPVWENCQFEFPLKKGTMPADGMRINLQVRVEEDGTAVENMLPGVASSGDARLLGVGKLDLTELCLGETMAGQPLPGVRDAWIPISMVGQEVPELFEEMESYGKGDPLAPPKKKAPEPPAVTGMVRVLVSYQPYGMEPQPKDVVALEAFSRRNPLQSSCRPLLPPLMPLVVLERRASFLLCEYTLPSSDGRKACVRIHRNAVFVIERQNMMDAAHNLALLPVDVMVATPLGQATAHTFGPVVAAGKELLMPALLSFKLVWVAARTSALAGLSGISALSSTFWQEGSQSLTSSHHRGHYIEEPRERRRAATAKFVQL